MFFVAAEPHGNDPEADYNKVVSLPPQEICIGTGNSSVTQIACGQHHTGKHRLWFQSLFFNSDCLLKCNLGIEQLKKKKNRFYIYKKWEK